MRTATSGCSDEAVRNALKKMGYTRKMTIGYKERSETAREAFQQAIKKVPVSRRVYVDESGVSHYYCRQHGRAVRGKRVDGMMPGKKFARVNVVADYCDGQIMGEYSYLRSTTAKVSEDWFCDFLLP